MLAIRWHARFTSLDLGLIHIFTGGTLGPSLTHPYLQVRTEYGTDAFGAMGDAFHNFTSDRGCFPGMGVGETYRHGLALYLIQQPVHLTSAWF